MFKRVKKQAKITCSNAAGKRGRHKTPVDALPEDICKPALNSESEGESDSELIGSQSLDSGSATSHSSDKDERGQDLNDGLVYKKALEEGMRDWIQAKKCCCQVSDIYFKNPCRTQGYIQSFASHVY